jgi:hypothetical protein
MSWPVLSLKVLLAISLLSGLVGRSEVEELARVRMLSFY